MTVPRHFPSPCPSPSPLLLLLLLFPSLAHAGFTETPPAGTFVLDEVFHLADLSRAYDDSGRAGPLIDPVWRYEPGGGLQGVIVPDARVRFGILVTQLTYGVTDWLSVAVAVPVVVLNTVSPDLSWRAGDFQQALGRAYSEDDFWQWAASMGQPRPGHWSGNRGVLSDIVIGARWRFSDHAPWFRRNGLHLALTVMGAIPTGTPADPEEIVAAGTTAWDLHSQGEFGVHLSADKTFVRELDGRLTIGVDVFYEAFFRHEYRTPRGTKHPLLLGYEPYVGPTYTLDPGDFSGASLQLDVVPWKGPARATWIVKGDPSRAEQLPPLVTVSLRYTHVHVGQSDWESDSPLWDWDREKVWRPGYKNVLAGELRVSLLRVGAPIELMAGYRNQTWIGGKNTRGSNVVTTGIRVPMKFW
ncbi:MAG: hypothetical protein FJ087_08765 [Deltaproteobacteria bacterium]|nr:hypothetical protein [Deltaproteobacteria bacterium]